MKYSQIEICGKKIEISSDERLPGKWVHRFSVDGVEMGGLEIADHYDSICLFSEDRQLERELEKLLLVPSLSSASHFVPQLRDALRRLEVSA